MNIVYKYEVKVKKRFAYQMNALGDTSKFNSMYIVNFLVTNLCNSYFII